MNAKDAYDLAASKGDISDLLTAIKQAALQGKTSVRLGLLNEFQVQKLTALGYFVLTAHSAPFISGRAEPDVHEISWRNGGNTNVPTNLEEALATLAQQGKTL